MLCYHVKKAGTRPLVLHQRRQLYLWPRMQNKVAGNLWQTSFPTGSIQNQHKNLWGEMVLSSRCLLKLPQEPDCFDTWVLRAHLSAWATGHQAPWGHKEDTSESPSLSPEVSLMNRVEYNFCNHSCESTWCSWLCSCCSPVAGAFGVAKSDCFPPWPEGVQHPLEEGWLPDSRSYVGSLFFPFFSHWDAVYQVPR